MYTGFKVNTSINKSVVSGLNETQAESLQRQVDTYTRKLEQQKRKLFGIQDQHKSVSDQYNKEKEKLNQLKKENTKAQNIILQSKVKNLEANLDKAVSTFDDTVDYNNRLKADIDMLRREKKNYLQMQKSLDEQIHQLQAESEDKEEQLRRKKRKAEELKKEMQSIRSKNQEEREAYLRQFSTLQNEYLNEKNSRLQSGLDASELIPSVSKSEIVDTQPLLKHRLKHIISSNKEKQKMIDQYKKHMVMIEQAFNEIKERSSITDLDEITNTFIKSEEQNYSLYNYMDSLSQNIDKLDEENRALERKIEQKEREDAGKQMELKGKGAAQAQEKVLARKQEELQMEAIIKQQKAESEELLNIIEKIKPTLSSTLIDLANSNFNDDPKKVEDYKLGVNINERNLQEYLSDLEKYINALLVAKEEAQTKTVTQMKDNITPYSKPIPSANYEDLIKEKEREKWDREKDDNRQFLDQSKFREYAAEFWEKRKNKIVTGKESN